MPLEVARELWRLLGFAEQDDDDVAFTQADVQALQYSHDLMKLGILSPERQAALVRTWGRSFARLAEWQTRLLTEVALESDDPVEQVTSLTEEVMPRLETLQNYVWRQHLAKASRRMMTTDSLGSDVTQLAVVLRRHRRVHLAEQGAQRRRARLLDRVLRGRVLGRRQRPRRPGDQEHRRRGPVRRRRPRPPRPTWRWC